MSSYLKKARLRSGLSQGDLVKKAGISLSTLKAYEQCRRNVDIANLHTAASLAAGIGCKLSDIVEDDNLRDLLLTIEKNK